MEHGDTTAGGASAFDVVLRGYDRRQVDDHLAGLEQRLSATAAQASELRGQRDSAAGRVRELEAGTSPSGGAAGAPSGLDGLGAHVESILRVATEEAANIRREAEEAVRRHAQAEEQLRTTFHGIAERLEPLVTRLTDESATARTAQSEMTTEVAALHKSAQDQADALMAAVKAATARMTSDAETRVEVTARQTADVREELALVRQVLTGLGSDSRPGSAPAGGTHSDPLGPSSAAPGAPALTKGTSGAAPSSTGGARAGARIPVAEREPGATDATGPVPVVTTDGPRPRPGADHGDSPTEVISMPVGMGNGANPRSPGREGPGSSGT